MLFAFAEEQLHPEADAEQRHTLTGRLPHHGVQTRRAQMLHCVAESPNARQQHAVRRQDLRLVRGDAAFVAEALYRFANAMQVAHPVIHDGDVHCVTALLSSTAPR
ncbi:hypothetical protein D3C74_328700 [compost metagenome]